jgi:hypothetical protein
MSDKKRKVETKEERRKKIEEREKKEAEKDLKPKMGEIRELEFKSKKKSKKSED